MKGSVMMKNPDEFSVFVPDQSSSRCLCAPNTLPCLSHVISIGFNSRRSHVVASQLKNKLRQYGSI